MFTASTSVSGIVYHGSPMQKEPHSPTRLSHRSLKLHRSVVGPEGAPPVLVLHGITGSRRYWLPRVLPLARRHRLIIPDLPGFGLSPKPFTDYTPDFFVETLMGLLQHEGLRNQKIKIVGHSLGGIIGLEIAARYPDLVDRLTLMNIPRLNNADEAHDIWFEGSASYRNLLMANSVGHNLAQMRRTGLRLTARYMKRLPWAVLADCRRFTFRSLTSTLEHCLLNYRIDELLPSVPRVPCLLIHGTEDQVAPIGKTLAFPAMHPFPALEVIEGAGHHPFHTHTATCLELVRAHLDDETPRLNGDVSIVSVPSGCQSPPELKPRERRTTATSRRAARWRIKTPSRRRRRA